MSKCAAAAPAGITGRLAHVTTPTIHTAVAAVQAAVIDSSKYGWIGAKSIVPLETDQLSDFRWMEGVAETPVGCLDWTPPTTDTLCYFTLSQAPCIFSYNYNPPYFRDYPCSTGFPRICEFYDCKLSA